MVQVAADDTHDDYVLCRGFDIRVNKFVDYEAGNSDKPGIPVAKSFDNRRPGVYKIAQIFPAVLPLQSGNPSPSDVPWRVGQNPGVSQTSPGHPADLSETVEELYTDEGVAINWMMIGAPSSDMVYGMLMENHPGEDTCFDIILGEWSSSTNTWEFDCEATHETAVDFHYGAPQPLIYSCGWFKPHSSGTTTSGWIYIVVSLDCTSRGSCANLVATGCGEA